MSGKTKMKQEQIFNREQQEIFFGSDIPHAIRKTGTEVRTHLASQ